MESVVALYYPGERVLITAQRDGRFVGGSVFSIDDKGLLTDTEVICHLNLSWVRDNIGLGLSKDFQLAVSHRRVLQKTYPSRHVEVQEQKQIQLLALAPTVMQNKRAQR